MTERVRLAALVDAGFIVYGMLVAIQGPVVPKLQEEFHLSTGALGQLLAASAAGAAVAVLGGGRLADRAGKKLVMLLGCGGLFLWSMAFAASTSIWVAALSLLLLGMSGGLVDGAVNALISDLFPEGSAVAMSLTHFFFGLGALLGPAYAGWLIETHVGWRGVYVGAALLAGVVTLILSRQHIPAPRRTEAQASAPFLRVAMQRPVLTAAGAIMLYVAAEIGLSTWLVLYLVTQRNVSLFQASLVLSLFWAMLTLGRLGCSWVALRLPAASIIWLSAFLGAVSYAAVVTVPDVRLVYVAVALGGLACAGQFPMLIAWATAQAPGHTGTVSGVVVAGADLGMLWGVWLIGAVAERVTSAGYPGLPVALFLLAVSLAVVAIIFFFIDRSERARMRVPVQVRAEAEYAGAGAAQ